MLEAVNSVLSNASYTKVVTDQQSVVNSFAANPEKVQQASLQAPYISLYIKVDVNFDRAILQIRDSDNGDVVRQIPTETQLEAYRRAQTVIAPERISFGDEEVNVSSSPDAPVTTGFVQEKSATPAPQTTVKPTTTDAPDSVSIDTQV